MKHKANIPPALRTTGSSSLVKIKRHKEGILDFPLELLEDNTSTVKEELHTQLKNIKLTLSNSGALALESKLWLCARPAIRETLRHKPTKAVKVTIIYDIKDSKIRSYPISRQLFQ